MIRLQQKRIPINYIALSFLLPFAGLLLLRLVCTLTFNGEYSMLYSDCYHQYYPFFVNYRKALLSGDSLVYNWGIGMGTDYIGLIAYYLASPLNLLSVLIPEGWLLGYFSFLMPLKLGFASMFFALFLRKLFGKEDFTLCMFGSFYALCAWALGYQWNIMWLDSFALLPLVIMGMYSLLTERKFILYTVSLFLAISCNYYIGFFICIFVFLSFICYQICCCKSIGRFFSDLLCIALFSMIAIGMTAFLTLPAYQALKTTSSGTTTFPKGFRLNIAKTNTWKGLLDAMRQVAGNCNGGIQLSFKEGLPNLFCGILTNILSFCFLTCRKISLREKLCCVALLLFFNVSFIIRQLDYIWHGFHFTNMIPYRFSFLYSFVLLYMAYRAWTHLRDLRLWQVLLSCALALGICICSEEIKPFLELLTGKGGLLPWGNGNTLQNIKLICADCAYTLFNVLFIAAYAVTFIYSGIVKSTQKEELHQNIGTMILWGIMGVELIMILINFGIWLPGADVSNYPKGTEATQSVISYMDAVEADTAFYRAETTHTQTLNDGALNGYNGISAFTSSANVKTTEFLRSLGFGAKNTYNRYCYEESSPVANLFLNLKYMIERDGKDKHNDYFDPIYAMGNSILLENNAYLPLGFLTNAQIVNVNFREDNNRFQFQNNLMSAATGIPKNNFNVLSGQRLTIIGTDVTLNSQNQTGYCAYETLQKAGTITYKFTCDQEGLFCFYVDQSLRNSFSVYLNGAEQALYTESYSLPQMLSVCNVTPGEQVEIRFRCPALKSGTINLCAAILDDTVFRQGYDVLSASVLDITTFTNTCVQGTIECDRDGILYTSIPQNGNWTATVDGEPAHIVLIGDAMIGLNLSRGSHTITLRYRNKAFTLGCMLSVACVLVFAGCIYSGYHPSFKRKKGRFEK